MLDTARERARRNGEQVTSASPAQGEKAVPARDLPAMGLMVALAIGLAVRAFHTLSADFPLNDGGLFYAMVHDLQHAHYRLPAFVSYNHANIPFAYSPFGFYVAGILTEYTPLDLLDVLRFVPLAVTTGLIGAFYLLARSLLQSSTAVLAATLAFALVPRSFASMLMGGGLTRSFGFLFAILACHAMHRLYTRPSWPCRLLAILWVGLTVLSHVGTIPFLALSIGLLFVFYSRSWNGIANSLLVALGATLLTAPWWATVLATHGPAPFLAAATTGSSVFSDAEARRQALSLFLRLGVGGYTGGTTGEPLFPLIGALALLGALAALVTQRFLLPVWWVATLVFDLRAGVTFASVPVAMLAGIAITDMLLPRMHGLTPAQPTSASRLWVTWGPAIVMGFCVLYAAGSSLLTYPSLQSATKFLSSLSPEERSAMQWVSVSTPPDSRFLVMPENAWSEWAADKTSEWFPTLAARTSVATVQGYEWIGSAFAERERHFKHLRECTLGVAACLDEWASKSGTAFSHIYIAQPPVPPGDEYLRCCRFLIASLEQDPRYEPVYEGPGAKIFARRLSHPGIP